MVTRELGPGGLPSSSGGTEFKCRRWPLCRAEPLCPRSHQQVLRTAPTHPTPSRRVWLLLPWDWLPVWFSVTQVPLGSLTRFAPLRPKQPGSSLLLPLGDARPASCLQAAPSPNSLSRRHYGGVPWCAVMTHPLPRTLHPTPLFQHHVEAEALQVGTSPVTRSSAIEPGYLHCEPSAFPPTSGG